MAGNVCVEQETDWRNVEREVDCSDDEHHYQLRERAADSTPGRYFVSLVKQQTVNVGGSDVQYPRLSELAESGDRGERVEDVERHVGEVGDDVDHQRQQRQQNDIDDDGETAQSAPQRRTASVASDDDQCETVGKQTEDGDGRQQAARHAVAEHGGDQRHGARRRGDVEVCRLRDGGGRGRRQHGLVVCGDEETQQRDATGRRVDRPPPSCAARWRPVADQQVRADLVHRHPAVSNCIPTLSRSTLETVSEQDATMRAVLLDCFDLRLHYIGQIAIMRAIVTRTRLLAASRLQKSKDTKTGFRDVHKLIIAP